MTHSTLITTKQSLTNLTAQAGNVKASGYLLTASIIMAYAAFGEDAIDEARDAVRTTLIASGFVKMDKGSKQPSDKARRFMKAADGAIAHHSDKVRSIMSSASNTAAQTEALALWVASFRVANNDYFGGSYLITLAQGISKKEAQEREASKLELLAGGEPEDSEVTHGKVAGKAKALKAGKAPEASAVLSDAATVNGCLASLRSIVAVKKGEKPSAAYAAAVVLLMSELDNSFRLLRNETIASASKESRKLAVELAKHLEVFKANNRRVAKQAKVKAAKAVKKAA